MVFTSLPKSFIVFVLPVRAGIDNTATSPFESVSEDLLFLDILFMSLFMLPDLDELSLLRLSRETLGNTNWLANLSQRIKLMHAKCSFIWLDLSVRSGYSKNTGLYISGDIGVAKGVVGGVLFSDIVVKLFRTTVQRYESFFLQSE